MADWHHIQREFTAGEISLRMGMRADTDVYKRAAAYLENFFPTLQGPITRTPGTKYLRNVGDLKARIMPYLTPGNERSLVLLTPTNLKLIRNITAELNEGAIYGPTVMVGAQAETTITYKGSIITDPDFSDGAVDWDMTPNQYTTQHTGNLGTYRVPYEGRGAVWMRPLVYDQASNAIDTCVLETEGAVEIDTVRGVLVFDVEYRNNPGDGSGDYTFTVEVFDKTDLGTPLFKREYEEDVFPVGSRFRDQVTVELNSGAAFTGDIVLRMTAVARKKPKDDTSNPHFLVTLFDFFANFETTLTEADITTPYTADELPDLHYVQSPYNAPADDPSGVSKPLVIVHPNHPPHWLYFDVDNAGGAQYVFEPIPFTNAPSQWEPGNYPATCSAYLGRLVLAGGQLAPIPGNPVNAVTETVWCTKVALWDEFSLPEEVDPDDSIEFTAIYRSPIQWVHGHKSLLVGALEMEYIANADGIYSPGDLGVHLHSTHGSNNVQPAGFGEAVLFPADGGTRVRSMRYSNEQQGWVAVDLNVFNPEVVYPRIRRMVRMRNPHQMAMVLSRSGTVAMFHSEGELAGWSRLNLSNGGVQDICVVTDNKGADVPYMLVKRTINGTRVLYLEAIPNFTYSNAYKWRYLAAAKEYTKEVPTNVLDELDHLEGKLVQVWTPGRFLGTHTVVGGEITLTAQSGNPLNVTVASVGLAHPAKAVLLPPEKDNPGSKSRFAEVMLRLFGSTIPLINGTRPPERDAIHNMNLSAPTELFTDVKVATRGWKTSQPITVEEHVPFRCEVMGVFGKFKSNSL